MRARLLPLLVILMAGTLLALGFPLAVSLAAGQQQRVVVDRIDDSARFAALAQFFIDAEGSGSTGAAERRETLGQELARYQTLYGIRAGIFYRNDNPLARSPGWWQLPESREGRRALESALAGRRSHDPPQVWPWQTDGKLLVISPVVLDGDVVAVVATESPTDQMRARILKGWLLIAGGLAAAMLVAFGAALKLTSWVLKPVKTLDAAAHGIATGRMNSRVAAAGGPRNSSAWPTRSTRWPTTSKRSWNSSGRSSPTPPTSSAIRSRHCSCGSSCSPSNCPRGTRRSLPCAPRASA